jgi:hypothetical protein
LKALVGAKRRGAPWLALLLVLGFLAAGCGGSGNSASKPAAGPATSAATSPPASTGLAPAPSTAPTGTAPDPKGVEGLCILGGKPINIEFSGVDANNVCAKYVGVLAALGLPNLAVHAYANDSQIPAGYTVGCYLTYPLDFGRLNAMVNGYVGRAYDASDPGPLAKSVCDRLLVLGWSRNGS